ncbi:MAG: MarR family winged helix-turn-helix transcriptional regulator, partial [Anaeroplasmataceae bacterium]
MLEVEKLDSKMSRINKKMIEKFAVQNELSGISLMEQRILRFLYLGHLKEQSYTVSNLAIEFGVTLPAIMHKLSSLEEKGIIFRVEDNFDKRIKYIKITDES